jgi:hypothetical protein
MMTVLGSSSWRWRRLTFKQKVFFLFLYNFCLELVDLKIQDENVDAIVVKGDSFDLKISYLCFLVGLIDCMYMYCSRQQEKTKCE